MARPNFVSPGAMGAAGIQEFLMQRELQRRQMMEEEFKRAALTQQAERDRLAGEDRKLAIEDRRQAQSNIEHERDFRRASTVAEKGMPGILDDATAKNLEQHGYGTLLERYGAGATEFLGTDATGAAQYSEAAPGMIDFKGGSEYQNRRAAEGARADQAAAANQARVEAARIAAEERAARDEESRAFREQQAQLGRDFQAGQNALGRSVTQQGVDIRREAEARQQQTATSADQRSKDAARLTSGATLDVLEKLIAVDPATGATTMKPGVSQQFGMRVPGISYLPGSDFAVASANLGRLRGRVIVDLLNEMKQQSRTGATGFGALNRDELRILENASSILNNPLISDKAAAEEMRRIYDIAKRVMDDAGAPGAAPTNDTDDALLDELLR